MISVTMTPQSAAAVRKIDLVPLPPMTGHKPSAQWAKAPELVIDVNKYYSATLATSQGNIGVELLAKQAPNTVNNFKFLADAGFYTRTPIHRIVKDFMVQSGDPTGTGTGGPGYSFADEIPAADAARPSIVYAKGTVAMANSGPNTNGSQFFLVTQDTELPPSYTVFGKVTSGMDALERLNQTKTEAKAEGGESSSPISPIGIFSVKVLEQAMKPAPVPTPPAPPKAPEPPKPPKT